MNIHFSPTKNGPHDRRYVLSYFFPKIGTYSLFQDKKYPRRVAKDYGYSTLDRTVEKTSQ